MSRPLHSGLARWGLLVTTVALGAVLVATGVAGWLAARQTSEAVVRARSMDLLGAVHRELREGGADQGAALERALAETAADDLRRVALVAADGSVVAEAGRGEAPLAAPEMPAGGWRQGPSVVRQGELVRATLPVWPGRGRGLAPWRKGGEGGRGWSADNAGRWRDRGAERGPGPPGRELFVVVEFEPVVAAAIVSRALVTLAASIVASALLLAAALVFWRMSRRAETMEAQLARDRQLKALGEMSAVLGHELRNPLAALKGHAQLLVERLGEDHPGRRGAETVVREALRLEALTAQILDFARTGELERAPTDPAEVARAAAGALSGAEVRVEVEQPLSDWPMDRARVEQVLANLLGNALAASPAGASIDLSVATDGPETLVFTVRDRGPGLSPGDEEWIFEPFRTGKVKGTGLGLAVARRIVEAHGGTVSAGNHPEGGALFRVRLPRR